ncbi:TetR/AcrR family transcriptional regulator [Actinoplanes sp. TRM 88003]|uniref:TetR/AcrR family transcriptional regulator n=1 Tax=Paractinoplanes aksuensis TaxID=2939490 RepID=A0ABT1DHX6_9ACTN|nr:TetR/AcrR family transcriptional regulator [Actinoplanes aksuensis]MCO8270424.1 TetR/AcrR family transcriptional regulator [Actinoplanes aksuensis]
MLPETAPPGRRDRKKQQTKDALIAAALRLVDDRGLDHVTVEDIAAAADVSPRTFFNYFATKDEAIVGDQFVDNHDVLERLRAVPADVPAVPAVLQAITPDLEAIEADGELWLVRCRVMANNPALVTGLISRSAQHEQDLADAIAARSGTDAALAAAVTGAAVRVSLMRWAASDGRARLTELVRDAFDLLAHGLSDPRPTSKDHR